MGASPNKIPTVESVDGGRWFNFVEGQSNAPAFHGGCTIGRIDRAAGPSIAYPTAGKLHAIVGAAFKAVTESDLTAIDAAFAMLNTAPGAGSFPDVKPSEWWDAKASAEKFAWCAVIADKFHAMLEAA